MRSMKSAQSSRLIHCLTLFAFITHLTWAGLAWATPTPYAGLSRTEICRTSPSSIRLLNKEKSALVISIAQPKQEAVHSQTLFEHCPICHMGQLGLLPSAPIPAHFIKPLGAQAPPDATCGFCFIPAATTRPQLARAPPLFV